MTARVILEQARGEIRALSFFRTDISLATFGLFRRRRRTAELLLFTPRQKSESENPAALGLDRCDSHRLDCFVPSRQA